MSSEIWIWEHLKEVALVGLMFAVSILWDRVKEQNKRLDKLEKAEKP